MPLIETGGATAEALKPYFAMSESELRKSGLFMAESPNVIARALEGGIRPLSVLCERKNTEGLAAAMLEADPDLPVYTASHDMLKSITGFSLTRGMLCLMERPDRTDVEAMLKGARRICVLYDICDATNVGIIFRSAAALGYDGIVLSKETCDPLNRRSIRVSMGTVFQIPWGRTDEVMPALRGEGLTTVATALTPESVSLEDMPVAPEGRHAVIFGSEGYGLPDAVISASDHSVCIPMHAGVDSLNVGAAAAILLWHFRAPVRAADGRTPD